MTVTYEIYFHANRTLTMDDLHKADAALPFGLVEVTDYQPHFVWHSMDNFEQVQQAMNWVAAHWGVNCFEIGRGETEGSFYTVDIICTVFYK